MSENMRADAETRFTYLVTSLQEECLGRGVLGSVDFESERMAVSGVARFLNGGFSSLDMQVPLSTDKIAEDVITTYVISSGECGFHAEIHTHNLDPPLSKKSGTSKPIVFSHDILSDITDTLSSSAFMVRHLNTKVNSIGNTHNKRAVVRSKMARFFQVASNAAYLSMKPFFILPYKNK